MIKSCCGTAAKSCCQSWTSPANKKLSDAKALVIGLGGLGSPIALYLASAGIGEITLVDDDDVDLSNLQRQIIHNEARIGTNKAESAALTLHALNNDCKVNTITHRLTQFEINTLLADTTIVFDATDNLATRHMINEVCWRNQVPLVSGAAIQWQGQITLLILTIETHPAIAVCTQMTQLQTN